MNESEQYRFTWEVLQGFEEHKDWRMRRWVFDRACLNGLGSPVAHLTSSDLQQAHDYDGEYAGFDKVIRGAIERCKSAHTFELRPEVESLTKSDTQLN